MRATAFLARAERFAVVGSTNDVVRAWLADGTPEVCLAIADEQTAGRGRDGRTWVAPPGAALLLSLGFRPAWLPRRTASGGWPRSPRWRWPMRPRPSPGCPRGRSASSGPTTSSSRRGDGTLRKLAGVLGETDGLGSDDPRVVVGIGINADWPAAAFPPDLADTMTSLRETGGRPAGRPRRPGGRVRRAARDRRRRAPRGPLRRGRLGGPPARRPAASWTSIRPDGTSEPVRALGVDPVSGALLVEDPSAADGRRAVVVGEIRHARLVPTVGV